MGISCERQKNLVNAAKATNLPLAEIYGRYADFCEGDKKIKHYGKDRFSDRLDFNFFPDEVKNLKGEEVIACVSEGSFAGRAIRGTCGFSSVSELPNGRPVDPWLTITPKHGDACVISTADLSDLFIAEKKDYKDPGFIEYKDREWKRIHTCDDFWEEMSRDIAKMKFYENFPFKNGDVPEDIKNLDGETVVLSAKSDRVRGGYVHVKGEARYVESEIAPKIEVKVDPRTKYDVGIADVSEIFIKTKERDVKAWNPLNFTEKIPEDVFEARVNEVPDCYMLNTGETVNLRESVKGILNKSNDLRYVYFGGDLAQNGDKVSNSSLMLEYLAAYGMDAGTCKTIFKTSAWGENCPDNTADKMSAAAVDYMNKKNSLKRKAAENADLKAGK